VGARQIEKLIPLLPAASDPRGLSLRRWGIAKSSRGIASRSSQLAAPSWDAGFLSRGITLPTAGGKSAEQGDHFAERGDHLAEQGDHSNVPIFCAKALDGQGWGRPPLVRPVLR